MIFDFRYHIASLVAVFLALGIGILIGSTLLGNDVIVQQQKQITNSLETQLKDMRSQNKMVQERVNDLETKGTLQDEFEKQVLPALAGGKLIGKNVAIIETNSNGSRDELLSTLETAGANVSSTTTILNGLNLGKQKAEIVNSLGLKDGKDEEIIKQLTTALTEGIKTGEKQAVLNTLAQNEMIKSVGEYGIPLSAVIIVGGSSNKELEKSNLLDNTIIEYLTAKKIPVFGVEDSKVAISYMKDYQKFSISTVDNIDTVSGQLALVYAMNGKSGHYGIKTTAERYLPTLEVPGGTK